MLIIGPYCMANSGASTANAQDNTCVCSGLLSENMIETHVTSRAIMLAYDDVLLELHLSTVNWNRRILGFSLCTAT
jgi:hypothetical protein